MMASFFALFPCAVAWRSGAVAEDGDGSSGSDDGCGGGGNYSDGGGDDSDGVMVL